MRTICLVTDSKPGDWDSPVRKGLYRVKLRGLGDCARTSYSAGDAAPFLDRETYEALEFQPPFDMLPSKSEYEERVPYHRHVAGRCEAIWSAGT